nr:myeloid leukemia factor 1 isoform X1 [Ipomoea batatas]
MQRGRGEQDGSSTLSNTFGKLGEKICSIFGSFFGSNSPPSKATLADDLPEASRSNGLVIEELDTDDDDGEGDFGENRQKIWSNSWANRNPRVWEETKHADVTTGEATHTISRGIHDKGHTLTRKLKSDGKVDTVETLHNLEEDELVGFDWEWKCNANKHLPGWNIKRNYNAGSTGDRDSPFREGFGLDVMARSSGAIQKKSSDVSNLRRDGAREVVDIEVQIQEVSQVSYLPGHNPMKMVEVEVEARQGVDLGNLWWYFPIKPFSLQGDVDHLPKLIASNAFKVAWVSGIG